MSMLASAGPPETGVETSGASVVQRGHVMVGGLGWRCAGRNHLFDNFCQIRNMSKYRRMYVPGGTYFFTVNLASRGKDLLLREIELLQSAYASVAVEHPVLCEAMVILPDHIHAVWTLPADDAHLSVRWKKIKATFTRHCPALSSAGPSKARKGERGIWQRRFWEHCIRDEADFAAHVDYCHRNPIKHGLVERPEAWPYSSVHRAIQHGEFVA
tara:strand:+ start:986 stop:1624 length:639 start_codon:yes stop_codon:yes gene_type:complete